MAGSVNKVILIGNIIKDPEIRQSADGKKIVKLVLATSETWKDQSGERKERTEWNHVVILNQGLAGIAENYVKKGTKLYVEGTLQTRKYTDGNGVEKYTTEVVLGKYSGEMTLLGSRNAGGASDGGFAPSFDAPAAAGWDSKPAAAPAAGGFDDEIPF